MVFISLLTPPLTSVLTLMLIRPGILPTATLLLAFVSFQGTLLFPGAVRNSILCLAPVPRQSTMFQLILPLNFSFFIGCWKIWVLHILHRLSYIVTIVVLFRLRIMMFSMSAPSILRMIVILCVIICLLASCVFFQLAHLIRLLIYLLRHFLLVVFVILFPNSRWLQSDHFEFVGGCQNMYIPLLLYQSRVSQGLLCIYYTVLQSRPIYILLPVHAYSEYSIHKLFSVCLCLSLSLSKVNRFHVFIFDWHLCQLICHVRIFEFRTNKYYQ